MADKKEKIDDIMAGCRERWGQGTAPEEPEAPATENRQDTLPAFIVSLSGAMQALTGPLQESVLAAVSEAFRPVAEELCRMSGEIRKLQQSNQELEKKIEKLNT